LKTENLSEKGFSVGYTYLSGALLHSPIDSSLVVLSWWDIVCWWHIIHAFHVCTQFDRPSWLPTTECVNASAPGEQGRNRSGILVSINRNDSSEWAAALAPGECTIRMIILWSLITSAVRAADRDEGCNSHNTSNTLENESTQEFSPSGTIDIVSEAIFDIITRLSRVNSHGAFRRFHHTIGNDILIIDRPQAVPREISSFHLIASHGVVVFRVKEACDKIFTVVFAFAHVPPSTMVIFPTSIH